jgi:hypothetical protein
MKCSQLTSRHSRILRRSELQTSNKVRTGMAAHGPTNKVGMAAHGPTNKVCTGMAAHGPTNKVCTGMAAHGSTNSRPDHF